MRTRQPPDPYTARLAAIAATLPGTLARFMAEHPNLEPEYAAWAYRNLWQPRDDAECDESELEGSEERSMKSSDAIFDLAMTQNEISRSIGRLATDPSDRLIDVLSGLLRAENEIRDVRLKLTPKPAPVDQVLTGANPKGDAALLRDIMNFPAERVPPAERSPDVEDVERFDEATGPVA